MIVYSTFMVYVSDKLQTQARGPSRSATWSRPPNTLRTLRIHLIATCGQRPTQLQQHNPRSSKLPRSSKVRSSFQPLQLPVDRMVQQQWADRTLQELLSCRPLGAPLCLGNGTVRKDIRFLTTSRSSTSACYCVVWLPLWVDGCCP